MPKCAIYARVSTDKQGDSVDHQVSLMKEYAARMNREGDTWEAPDHLVYIDEAVSGFKVHILDRPAMVRMIEDAKERKFNTILFKGISRFARDTEEALAMLRRFDALGIRVISYEENYDSATSDTLIFTIHAAVAQAESKKIGLRVSLGNKEKARSGKWANATTPFGYDMDKGTKKLIINHEQADIVRRIFQMYLNEGKGSFKIAETLNHEGLLGGRKNPWSAHRIRDIIRNRAVVGDIVYGTKRYKYVEDVENGGKKSQTVYLPENEWAVCENAHEPIIDRVSFGKAQKLLDSRKTGQCFRHAVHPLTGKLICGKCGQGMVGQKRSYKNHNYVYYICKTYHKYGRSACSQANINASKIEPVVIEELKARITQYMSGYQNNFSSVTSGKTIEQYQKQIKSLDRKIEKVNMDTLSLIKRSHMLTDDQFTFANDQLIKELKQLQDQKQVIEEELLALSGDEADDLIEEMQTFFQETEYTREQLRKYFQDMLISVTVHDGELDIVAVF